MTFIKKRLNLNGYQPFHNIITNRQIAEIEEYNNIIALAHHQAQNIIDNANLEANNIVSHANKQAKYILDIANSECENRLVEMTHRTQTMLGDAGHQVQDILLNSEQKATKDVWNHAQQLISSLEQTHQQFYQHTHELIKGILASIIKKLTSNLEVQDRMQIIVHQVFAKAQEVEYASLFFNPKDFEKLPSLHIPQNWKLEKDNMLEQGLCRLVGAGGEWKTSIALIEHKIIEAIEYNSDNNHIQNDYQVDTLELEKYQAIDNDQEYIEKEQVHHQPQNFEEYDPKLKENYFEGIKNLDSEEYPEENKNSNLPLSSESN